MEESYAVCPERNSAAAYRRFFGTPERDRPWRRLVRRALRYLRGFF